MQHSCKGGIYIEFTERQKHIIELVKAKQPITSENLAEHLHMTRAALRPDLTILTMLGVLDARPKVGYFYLGKTSKNIIVEFMKSIRVADIKSMPVVVSEDTSVYDAIVTLFLEDVGTLYVQNKGALVGVVSRKDIIKTAIGNTDIHKVPIGIIMTRMPNIVYATDNESVLEAAGKIMVHEIDSLPVVEPYKAESGKELYKITGKISKTNITRFLFNLSKE